jgi:hypothetical protein
MPQVLAPGLELFRSLALLLGYPPAQQEDERWYGSCLHLLGRF